MTRSIPRCLSFLVLSCSAIPAAHAGDKLYATSGPISPILFSIDSATGATMSSVAISGEEALFGGLSATPDGTALYSIDGFNDPISDRTFRIDAATGAGVVVGDTGENWNFRSVEVHPVTGVLYAMRDNALYMIDTLTGAASLVAGLNAPTLDQATALAIAPNGAAWVTDIGDRGLFALDLSSGTLTHEGNLVTPPYFQDLAVAPDGTLWGVGSGGGVYTIDVFAVTATFEFASLPFAGIAFEPGDSSAGAYCFGDGTGSICPCGNAGGSGEGCANGTGSGAALAASGSASVANDTLVLSVTGSVPNQPGLFFQGNNAVNNGQGFVFGDGLRCAGSNVVRLQTANANGSGEVSSSVDVSSTGGVGVGETKRYQWWYRDPIGSPCGAQFNLSSGIEVVWGA